MNGRVSYLVVILLCFSTFAKCDTIKFKLNDGNEIPAVALGTSLGHLSDGTRILSVNNSLAMAVEWALGSGYRHIDTAALYRTEDEVGLGIRRFMEDKNISRDDIYVTTKLWNDAHEQNEVVPALKRSLKALNLEYADLYLIHFPMAYNKDKSISQTDYLETWRGMEEAKRLNLARSIGVSNFNLTQLARLYENASIKPAVLQIEVNPSITEMEIVNWCKERNIIVMGYSPYGAILGRKIEAPGPKADHQTFVRLSEKYGKTVPQILLRYLIDRGIVAISRSTNKKHIEDNINLFDFSLTTSEVNDLNAMNVNYRLRVLAKWYSHPHFPFEKKELTPEQIQHIIENSKED